MPKSNDNQPTTETGLTAAEVGKKRIGVRRRAKKPQWLAAHRPAANKSQTRLPTSSVRHRTKQGMLIDLLKRKTGGTINEAVKVTGWQPHSVRGAISGTLKKKLGLVVTSNLVGKRGRVYRIVGAR